MTEDNRGPVRAPSEDDDVVPGQEPELREAAAPPETVTDQELPLDQPADDPEPGPADEVDDPEPDELGPGELGPDELGQEPGPEATGDGDRLVAGGSRRPTRSAARPTPARTCSPAPTWARRRCRCRTRRRATCRSRHRPSTSTSPRWTCPTTVRVPASSRTTRTRAPRRAARTGLAAAVPPGAAAAGARPPADGPAAARAARTAARRSPADGRLRRAARRHRAQLGADPGALRRRRAAGRASGCSPWSR